ncbi:MAG: hypothetical protein RSB39_01760 [Oscillospiraceae bacterium]
MLLDLINLERIRKAIIYAGLILLTLLVQNIVLSRIAIFGVRAFIVPIIVVAVGFFEGGVWGAVFGLFMGVFCDISMNDVPVLMTVLCPLIGFFSGALAIFFVNKRFFSFFFVCLAALAITAVCQMFKFIVLTDTNAWSPLITGALQTLLALPFTFAVYYPCRALSRLDLTK